MALCCIGLNAGVEGFPTPAGLLGVALCCIRLNAGVGGLLRYQGRPRAAAKRAGARRHRAAARRAPEQQKEPHDGDPKEHARVSHRGRHLQPSESAAHALHSEAPSRPRPAGNPKETGLTRNALATRTASREAEERSPTAPHGNPSQSETHNPPTCTKRPGRVANRACGDPHPTPLW